MFLRPVDIFGDIAVLAGTPYPGTVIALEAVQVWSIPAQTLHALIARYPDLAQAAIRHLAERVLHYVNLVEDLSLRSVEARLAKTLLDNAQLHDGQLSVPRREWTTFEEMAVRLGTVRDVLGRAAHAGSGKADPGGKAGHHLARPVRHGRTRQSLSRG